MAQVKVKNGGGFVVSVLMQAQRQKYAFDPERGEHLVTGPFETFFQKKSLTAGKSVTYEFDDTDPSLVNPEVLIYVNGGVNGLTTYAGRLDLSKSHQNFGVAGTICKPTYTRNDG